MLSRTNAIAFDLDGTLVDSLPGLTVAVNQMLAAMGCTQVSQQKVSGWIGNGMQKLILRALREQFDEVAAESEQFFQAQQLFNRAYAEGMSANTFLYPGVIETLKTLSDRGYSLNLVTNKSHLFTSPLLKALGIDSYFDQIISGDLLARKKPDPLPLQHICQQLDIDITQLLMVGDSENDIIAARNAGCPCVALNYGYNYGKPIAVSRPDYLLDSFADLLPLLN